MRILLDTSALAKRYKIESGRDRVEAALEGATAVVLAAHCKIEIASGLCRDMHDGVLSAQAYAQMVERIEMDFADFEVRPISAEIETYAMAAMERVRLRAMDAFHIGTAQAARVSLFVTADRQQAQAAKAVGLKTELIEA